MTLLSPGDPFPHLELATAGGDTVSLPEALNGRFGVVLFYRGSWCPYCNAQLRAFQRAAGDLDDLGVSVYALSVDDEATTAQTVEKHRLTFPVGFGADAAAVSAATGAYVDPQRGFLQSTGFVLAPDGSVVVAAYSSGAIGRLVPEDVVGLVAYVKEHAPA